MKQNWGRRVFGVVALLVTGISLAACDSCCRPDRCPRPCAPPCAQPYPHQPMGPPGRPTYTEVDESILVLRKKPDFPFGGFRLFNETDEDSYKVKIYVDLDTGSKKT